MSNSVRTLRPVDSDDLPIYPISAEDRLDSHFFIQWNIKRWRKSEFRGLAEPEVGWFGFLLFCEAHDETPVGTLPTDERLLAKALGISVDRWKQLCKREITPLHNWSLVRCDNGEIRLAHPVVTEVVVEALGSKRRNATKNADDRMRKRLGTISHNLKENIPGGARVAGNDDLLNRISDWIETTYPGGSATTKRIREAWEALSQHG